MRRVRLSVTSLSELEMIAKVDKSDKKSRLEAYAVRYFADELQRRYNMTLTSADFGDNPDVYCSFGSKKIGIEVTHLYGSERDARALYGRSKDYEKTKEHRIAHALVPMNERVISDLNFILADKSQNRYGSNTW